MQELRVKDRRIFARIPAKISLRYLNSDSKKKGEGQIHDISASGIGLVTDQKLHIPALLDIWLRVPDNGDPLHVKGEVIWVTRIKFNKYRVGVKLEKPELMGISRVLNAPKSEQNISVQRRQSAKKWLLLKCLSFLGIRLPLSNP